MKYRAIEERRRKAPRRAASSEGDVMDALLCNLTGKHQELLDRLDDVLRPFLLVRQKKTGAPENVEEITQALLNWMKREFFPHLAAEEEAMREILSTSPEGECLFRTVREDHARLVKLMHQVREEVQLLLHQTDIREAWWDTLDLSTIWCLRKTMLRHFEFEHQEILPQLVTMQMQNRNAGSLISDSQAT